MKMKKLIAVFLTVLMIAGVMLMPVSGANDNGNVPAQEGSLSSAFAQGEDSIIIFVTGIGQSYSYLFDESYTKEGAFEKGTLQDYENYAPLIAQGKHSKRWNLFNSFDEAFEDSSTIMSLLKVVSQLLVSSLIRKSVFNKDDIKDIVKSLFRFNLVGEDGNGNSRVVTPRYNMPVSQFPGATNDEGVYRSEAKERFYSSIPCKDIAKQRLGENYEDYLYVFNYSAFSYTSKNVEALHDFIETALKENKVGATQVVLVPMSMGASVVTAYMSAYPQRKDNHIKRVVSIVGAWDGSDVVADLLTQQYCENSADLFYNGLIGDLIGEPWGYVVNIALRLFPKQVLRDFIDLALEALSEDLFCSTPSLCNLIPSDRYDEVKDIIASPVVRSEADSFQNAKKTIRKTMSDLENEGVTFSFISGYGLPFGAQTDDYKMFGFMKSAPTTNSDEIINIDSTAPGTSYVTPGTTFDSTVGRVLSPDGSLDISTTYYKDSTWFFYEQKHELEYNNTAIALALELATGNIKTVSDCDNLAEDGYYYPQFNGARNLKKLNKNYLPDLEKYCEETGYTLNASQQATLDKVKAMTNSTVNDFQKDNELIEELRLMLIDIGIYGADKQDSAFDKVLNDTLKGANDITYKLFGAKGFLDFAK